MTCRVLLTNAGGMVVPGIVNSMRAQTADGLVVFGVDRNTEGVGLHFLDRHFVIAEQRDFAAEVLEIAKAQAIDLVIPGADEAVLALARARQRFSDAGIVVAVSDYRAATVAGDKGSMMRFLEDQGLPCPRFSIPTSVEELREAAAALGYPRKKIVFKPRKSSGARGFWIIDSKINKFRDLIMSPDRRHLPLEWLEQSLQEAEAFPEAVLMEYLPGADFNVDILARNGRSAYIVPNQRVVPDAGPVQVGRIRADALVQELCRRIVAAFGFDYWINIEVAYGEADTPLAYEINPRISAPIAFNSAAGVNLLALGIQMAMGEPIDETLAIEETRVMRYWNELAIPPGQP